MAASRKVIITCAVTGSGHTPTMSPHLPYTVEDVVSQSVAAARAGAAVIHLHARDPRDGSPTADPAVFREYLKGIKAETDAVISITSGGGTGMSVQDRLRVIYDTKPELCTLNLGTFNYGSFPMIPKYAGKWKFDWEEPYLESTRSEPFVSTFADIEHMLTDLTTSTGCRFEYEAYDVGHLYTLAYYHELGLIKPPIFMQTIMGVMGGIGPEVEHIAHMKMTADRLFGADLQWSVLGGGRHQFNMVTAAACMGGHVRVGLEDGLFIAKGRLAQSNAEQVEKMVRILGELSLEVATPGRRPRDPRAQGPRPGRLVSSRSDGYAPPESVGTVAVVGTGVIGAGWAAHFLRMGFDVAAWDPGDGAAERLTASVRHAWPVLEKLGLRPGASPSRLRFAGSLAEAVDGAGFVQESAPEVLDLKITLLAELDAAAPRNVVIGSSTSGLHDERHGGGGRDARVGWSSPTRSTRRT